MKVNRVKNFVEELTKTKKRILYPTNLSVKKVCQILTRKPPSSFQVFKIVKKGPVKDRRENRESGLLLDELLRTFEVLFPSGLCEASSPKRFADHAIEVEKGSRPPHGRLYQPSAAEQKAAKEYVENLLRED